ncbi:MAG: T9SS type A sorting domain-containing protein [Phaeodactylibacter sp.]|nr:T9SS type A sorting domain-containing protein [Phaeodactylibacter sp.]
MKKTLLTSLILSTVFSTLVGQNTYTYPFGPFSTLYDGALIEADYWDTIPRILSAGVGFCDIIGIEAAELNETTVLEAGGAWLSDINCGENDADFTSTVLPSAVQPVYIYQNEPWEFTDGAIGMDGLPIVFSWPVLSHTVDVTDFRFILSTGDTIVPYAAGLWPNYENNERNCVVVFGELANRLPSTDPNSRFPVKCEVVDDGTPLLLVGPNNQVVSAVGMSWETNTSPYDLNQGPRLVGAKLNHIGDQNLGEQTNNIFFNNLFGLFPNDEFALYDRGDFRLRMLTSGGFSPDGVRGVKPTDFERFFRIHATGPDDTPMLLEKTDTVYTVKGGTLGIIGLSDLGQSRPFYDDCYDEDRDNYIDIIIEGDEAAARNITYLEIPSLEEGYDAFYNPGGPGSTPFSGVSYSSPGPRDIEPVIMALDDPWRVNGDSTLVVSINDFELEETLMVFPNPSSYEIRIVTEANFNGCFEIYSILGDRLLESREHTINISQLHPGTYILLKRYLNGGLRSFKFIKL